MFPWPSRTSFERGTAHGLFSSSSDSRGFFSSDSRGFSGGLLGGGLLGGGLLSGGLLGGGLLGGGLLSGGLLRLSRTALARSLQARVPPLTLLNFWGPPPGSAQSLLAFFVHMIFLGNLMNKSTLIN